MRKINLILGFCLLSLVVSAKRVGVYCFFADNGAHLYEDENVKLAVGMSDANVLSVIIVNKTEWNRCCSTKLIINDLLGINIIDSL